ncbi:mast/stem cell growth factor receptor Kit-like isoform X2 [Gambusia affinis]|uniref:mast/stem cell growth factor receptor Kit-like isoform X2 n=1 Tax=Gambusia affinis TaxID=33528 RepID=UPI001CDD4F47|nr:mast/stem cell growth factor receptor Kit-like isoform X2 [Gambusia affinis]
MKLRVKQQFGAKRLILSCHVSLTSSCCGLAQQEVLHFSLRRTDRTASAADEMNADEMNGNEMNTTTPPLLLCLFLSCSCQTVSCHELSRPSSLVVSPNQPQFYEYGSVSLSCEQFGPDRWTVWRQTNSGLQVFPCSEWGSQTSSTCTISTLKTSDSGVYWCESRHRDSSHIVIITVTTKEVVLIGPVLPVMEGDDITLTCQHKRAPGSNAEFLKDGSKMASEGSLILRNVSRAHEGGYTCRINGVTSETYWLLLRDVSQPASLSVSPDYSQVLEYQSFSLSCSSSAPGWTIKRFSNQTRKTSSCGEYGDVLSSSVCRVQTAKASDSALYWCESPTKQRSNTVQITVYKYEKPVVLLTPALPVASGRNVNLTCLTRSPSAASADFYRNGSFIGNGSWSFLLRSVSTDHEGSYHCRMGAQVSPPGWLSVRDPDPDPDPDSSSPLHSILWKILYAPVSIFYFIPTCVFIYKLRHRATGWSPAGRTRTSGPRRAAEEAAAGGDDYDDAMAPVTTRHHF